MLYHLLSDFDKNNILSLQNTKYLNINERKVLKMKNPNPLHRESIFIRIANAIYKKQGISDEIDRKLRGTLKNAGKRKKK